MSPSEQITLREPISERDHILGSSNPKVTVVMYGDYESLDCQRAHRVNLKLVDELLNSVRLVYRHFPLKTHPRAFRAAEAAEAAAAQNKFWEMHRLLYLRPDKLSDGDFHKHAREIGLDLDRFKNEMANNTYADQILNDYRKSIMNGITGAPTTFVNGVLYAMSGAQLIAAVKSKL